MTTLKASDVMVRALENEGVERIFGIPGEENLDFIDSLRQSSIELILTRHEQAAAFMAATYGRLTGTPGVCLTTLGPGALNLATGAAYAHLGGMPMVMITGQKGIRTAEQARFQIVNTVATMGPLTKSTHQISSARMIPTLVREAFRTAQDERPGPVHLELPEDIASVPVENFDLISPHTTNRAVAADSALDHAAEVIRRAERPLLMVGADAARSDCSQSLADFVPRVGIPYFTTQMGKGTVSGSVELYMGTAALTDRDYVHDAIEKADVIVTIGHDTTEKPPFTMNERGPTVVHLGYRAPLVEQVYFPQAEAVGDLGPTLSRLADMLEGQVPNAQALLPMREGILAKIAERATEHRFTPQRIVHDVRGVMPVDGIVALDNGMYKIWFARNYRTTRANTLLLDNALATMGAGLPSAIAAKLTHSERRVMAVVGDGGFMMNSQELETAVRLGLDLVVLILEDNAYGMIRWKQESDGMADFGMTFTNPDFVTYAQAYGATGRRVEDIEDLRPTLESAFTEGGVQVVVAPVDYTENKRVLIDELGRR
ncbi:MULTISPECIES: acetolactate synthase large subunit [unclassified Brevibacterium]|uniref:acetolactate synthase large subunit n=1 Tax=unclassified Brevibacterium TaxID=2614124 RepID=UPI001E2E5B6E|nr:MULTISPECIES: acetolactate synthase large subunit [unclassified Brevibacterium]MCD1286006.1 acetolactate synthase large subunit [Brevibacterium sp. CCUG 69071]MDK8435072.1 acetolactate synthase large subunit [Brevibacterium sp. H-BE7]